MRVGAPRAPMSAAEIEDRMRDPTSDSCKRASSGVSTAAGGLRIAGALGRLARVLREMLYGATVYEMVRDLAKERSRLEHLFVLLVFGDFLGVPVMPPYHTLRLLPYVVPLIPGWRLSMLRERDLVDLCDQEIT